MRVESEGNCAVENCNLGRNVRNSSIVNLSPINGIKIYGVHTHSLSHTFFFAFNAAFFIHAKSRKFMGFVPWSLFLFFFSFPLYSFDTKLCALPYSLKHIWLACYQCLMAKYRKGDRKSTFNS